MAFRGLLFQDWTMRAIESGVKTCTRRNSKRFANWKTDDVAFCLEAWGPTASGAPIFRAAVGPSRRPEGGWRPGIHLPWGLARIAVMVSTVRRLEEDPFELSDEEIRAEGAENRADWIAKWTEINGPERGPRVLYRIGFSRLSPETTARACEDYAKERFQREIRKSAAVRGAE